LQKLIIKRLNEQEKTMKLHRIRAMFFSLPIVTIVTVSLCLSPCVMGQPSGPELPKAKQTSLGLYLTAREAYEKWLTDPENITVLDVRTFEEYLFIGHASMAWNVPLMSQTHEWDADKQHFKMQPNTDFVTQVKEFAKPTDTILVMCRSGGRSAMAVNQLAAAGFTNVYNITDGMEGDEVEDPDSVFQGQRLVNGWKNSGVPWTYEIDHEKIKLTE
jgi:rhodanese-related sulfurtransferase